MTSYTGDQKAAVLAALLAGQSIGSIAREYKIPKSTISGWKNEPAQVRESRTQKNEIGGLILEYLKANLTALKVQTIMFSDQAWLAKQNAADVAVLHGVMTDKAIRIIEAMSKANDLPDDQPADD